MAQAPRESGTLGADLAQLELWDPAWAEAYRAVVANPWESGVLSPKVAELCSLAVNAACTLRSAEGIARHAARAIAAGASRAEVLMVLKMAAMLAIHSASLAAPILLEEAAAIGAKPSADPSAVATPACDAMRAAGAWNDAWTPFFEADPTWTEAFIAAAAPVYGGSVFDPKTAELLSIAFDASITHLYAPGTRRHIRAALARGASVEEVMAVIKICVACGAEALNLAIPILARLEA